MSPTAPTDEQAEEQAEAVRVATIEREMKAKGEPTEISQQIDYFGEDVTYQVVLPDGVSWVQHRKLMEGDRKKYRNSTSREVRIERASGDARMPVAQGDDLHLLLTIAISGWNLARKGSDGKMQAIPYSDQNLRLWLDKAPPEIIDLIHADVQKHNSWLMADATIEDIDGQIEQLQEMRERKVKEQAEGNS